jgi:hypothetical protein
MASSSPKEFVVFDAGKKFLVRPGAQTVSIDETFVIENRSGGVIEPFFPMGLVTPQPAGKIDPGRNGSYTVANKGAQGAYPFAVYVDVAGRRDFAEGESTPWIIIR